MHGPSRIRPEHGFRGQLAFPVRGHGFGAFIFGRVPDNGQEFGRMRADNSHDVHVRFLRIEEPVFLQADKSGQGECESCGEGQDGETRKTVHARASFPKRRREALPQVPAGLADPVEYASAPPSSSRQSPPSRRYGFSSAEPLSPDSDPQPGRETGASSPGAESGIPDWPLHAFPPFPQTASMPGHVPSGR